MSNIASLTNEVLLAYVLPAAIVELSFLLFIQNRWNLQWDLSAPSSILGFLGLSVAVGFLLDALGHLLVREWQRREKPCLVWQARQPNRSLPIHGTLVSEHERGGRGRQG